MGLDFMIITYNQLQKILIEALLVEGKRIDGVIAKYGVIMPWNEIMHVFEEENHIRRSFDFFPSTLERYGEAHPDRFLIKKSRQPRPDSPYRDDIRITHRNLLRKDRKENRKIVALVFFVQNDPAPRRSANKYLDWMMHQSVVNYEPIMEIVQTLKEFEARPHIQPRDIWQYEKLADLRFEIEKAATLASEKELTSVDAERVYEDGRMLVIHPKTERGSCHYGRGTKWCIAATVSHNYFTSYDDDGFKHYFVILKALPAQANIHKMAFTYGTPAPGWQSAVSSLKRARVNQYRVEGYSEMGSEAYHFASFLGMSDMGSRMFRSNADSILGDLEMDQKIDVMWNGYDENMEQAMYEDNHGLGDRYEAGSNAYPHLNMVFDANDRQMRLHQAVDIVGPEVVEKITEFHRRTYIEPTWSPSDEFEIPANALWNYDGILVIRDTRGHHIFMNHQYIGSVIWGHWDDSYAPTHLIRTLDVAMGLDMREDWESKGYHASKQAFMKQIDDNIATAFRMMGIHDEVRVI